MRSCTSLLALAAVLAAAPTAALAQETRSADPTAVDEVVVRAQRANQTEVTQSGQAGVLGTRDGLDLPFNLRSYNSALILNQQSETLGEVLQNDPTVRTTLGFGNFSEQFVIRGFPLYGDDVSIDGLYGVTPRQLVSPELYEQVQILNGANAFLNGVTPGSSGIGGGVNLLFKRAGDAPLTRVVGQYRGDSIGGGEIDVSRRFGSAHQFGVRVNVAGHSGDRPIDGEFRDDITVGGGFDWRTDRARVLADFGYQKYRVQQGRPSVTLGAGVTTVPTPPPSHANYAQAWSYTTLRDTFGVLDAEYDLTKWLTAYVKGGARDGAEAGDYSSLTVINNTGAATGGRLFVPRTDLNGSVQGGLRGVLDLGPVHNAFEAGGSAEWNTGSYGYAFGTFPAAVRGTSAYNFATNLYTPVQVARPPNTPGLTINLVDPYPINQTDLHSWFLSDTASGLDGRVQLTAGVRGQTLDITGYAYATGAVSSRYDKSAVTPVVGLIVQPVQHVALYFNRIEGLAQGPTAPSTATNAGQIFAPYMSTQYETGVKYEAGRVAATLAFYTLTQPNAYSLTLAGAAAPTFVVDGRQRNRGVELTFTGELAPGLRLIGGATVTDAELRRVATAAYNGNTAIGVPDYTVNANLEYDLPTLRGLTLTGRILQTGEQYVNQANTLKLPSWFRFDLGARYVFTAQNRPVTLRAYVENLADNSYWSSAFGGYLVQGAPRTVKLSASVDF